MKTFLLSLLFLPFFSATCSFVMTKRFANKDAKIVDAKPGFINKKIVLFDEVNNTLLFVNIEPFLGINYFDLWMKCFTDNFPVFNGPGYCPISGQESKKTNFTFLSCDSDYDLHKAICNNQPELTKFIVRFCHPDVNSRISGKTPLQRAIKVLNPSLIKCLLANSPIIVDKLHLEKTKKIYTSAKNTCEENLKSHAYYFKRRTEHFREICDGYLKSHANHLKMVTDSQEIGRMLINHLGLYTAQSCISKQGFIGIYGLPAEIAVYIARFIND